MVMVNSEHGMIRMLWVGRAARRTVWPHPFGRIHLTEGFQLSDGRLEMAAAGMQTITNAIRGTKQYEGCLDLRNSHEASFRSIDDLIFGWHNRSGGRVFETQREVQVRQCLCTDHLYIYKITLAGLLSSLLREPVRIPTRAQLLASLP
jgi:hypothetical protein